MKGWLNGQHDEEIGKSVNPASCSGTTKGIPEAEETPARTSKWRGRKEEVKVQSEWSLCMEHAILSPNWTFKKLTWKSIFTFSYLKRLSFYICFKIELKMYCLCVTKNYSYTQIISSCCCCCCFSNQSLVIFSSTYSKY